jgi:hypothetical protein
MSISYPLSLPSNGGIRRVTFRHRSAVSLSRSPFSFASQAFAHDGDLWMASLEFRAMDREDAEAWIAWRLSLNGQEGTFLLGDPKYTTPRGTWADASPVLDGAHAAGVKTISVLGIDGLTVEAGDKFQVGSGSTAHLHMVVQSVTHPGGSPSTAIDLEIWPRLRAALTDQAALTLTSPKGLFRLAVNENEWEVDPEEDHMLSPLNCIEAI